MKTLNFLFVFTLCSSCSFYGVNAETSQIGNLNDQCIEDSAWAKLTDIYTVDKISDTTFLKGLEAVQNHFIKPDYILYFPEGPREIIGCDYYSVRVAYNPLISSMAVHGLSNILSDEEQVRIRNRVQKALLPFQCKEGQIKSMEWMETPAIFSHE